jgi:hypothetical protein
MDASQITKLLQKQNTRTLHRPQTVDSSTLTWRQQIQSSTYVNGLHATSSANCCSDTQGLRMYGGQGKQTTLITGSVQQYPNVLASATGSASEVYSSDRLLLQQAGRHACAVQNEMGVQPTALTLPACYCENTNAPADPTLIQANPQTNPYLPPFDTYYALKNPCVPTIDQNQKHFVDPNCCDRPSS